MRRAITRVASAVGVCMCVAIVASHSFGASAGPPAATHRGLQCGTVKPIKGGGTLASAAGTRSGPLSHYDSRVQASFVVRLGADRQAQLVVKSKDLEVEKTVGPDGSFTISLTAGAERVVVAMQKAGVDVLRNGASLHLEFGQAGEDDLLAVQRLLAGSKAVRLHHILAANLEPSTLTRPGGAATLLTDTFLGLLGGDIAANDRFGRELARRRQATSATIVRARFGREDGPDSCYVRWENEVMAAWYQLASCKGDYSIWNPLQEICNIRYYMRVESAWWELISCCAIPLKVE